MVDNCKTSQTLENTKSIYLVLNGIDIPRYPGQELFPADAEYLKRTQKF